LRAGFFYQMPAPKITLCLISDGRPSLRPFIDAHRAAFDSIRVTCLPSHLETVTAALSGVDEATVTASIQDTLDFARLRNESIPQSKSDSGHFLAFLDDDEFIVTDMPIRDAFEFCIRNLDASESLIRTTIKNGDSTQMKTVLVRSTARPYFEGAVHEQMKFTGAVSAIDASSIFTVDHRIDDRHVFESSARNMALIEEEANDLATRAFFALSESLQCDRIHGHKNFTKRTLAAYAAATALSLNNKTIADFINLTTFERLDEIKSFPAIKPATGKALIIGKGKQWIEKKQVHELISESTTFGLNEIALYFPCDFAVTIHGNVAEKLKLYSSPANNPRLIMSTTSLPPSNLPHKQFDCVPRKAMGEELVRSDCRAVMQSLRDRKPMTSLSMGDTVLHLAIHLAVSRGLTEINTVGCRLLPEGYFYDYPESHWPVLRTARAHLDWIIDEYRNHGVTINEL
jgi:hypothetical protein